MKTVELLDKIKDSESIIGEEMYKKTQAKKDLDEMLKGFCSPFKKYLADKIFENFSEEYKELVIKDRNLRKGPKTLENGFSIAASISTEDDNISYSEATFCSQNFDPDIDDFEIRDYELSYDKKHIKFRVECIKNRQYLGITGCWIPSLFSTNWLDVSEVEEKENELWNPLTK